MMLNNVCTSYCNSEVCIFIDDVIMGGKTIRVLQSSLRWMNI